MSSRGHVCTKRWMRPQRMSWAKQTPRVYHDGECLLGKLGLRVQREERTDSRDEQNFKGIPLHFSARPDRQVRPDQAVDQSVRVTQDSAYDGSVGDERG